MQGTQPGLRTDRRDVAPADIDSDTVMPAADAGVQGRADALRLKRFELLHGQMPSTIVGSLTTGLLAIALLRSLDAGLALGSWFGLLTAVSLVRTWQVLRYRHTRQDRVRIEHWRRAFIISNCVVGCVWGALMTVPHLGDIRQAAAIIVVLGGVMGTSSVLYAASFRASSPSRCRSWRPCWWSLPRTPAWAPSCRSSSSTMRR